MKKNFMALAFMLVFASTTAFADGETGHGTRTSESEPPPIAVSTATQTTSSETLLDQFLNIVNALIA